MNSIESGGNSGRFRVTRTQFGTLCQNPKGAHSISFSDISNVQISSDARAGNDAPVSANDSGLKMDFLLEAAAQIRRGGAPGYYLEVLQRFRSVFWDPVRVTRDPPQFPPESIEFMGNSSILGP